MLLHLRLLFLISELLQNLLQFLNILFLWIQVILLRRERIFFSICMYVCLVSMIFLNQEHLLGPRPLFTSTFSSMMTCKMQNLSSQYKCLRHDVFLLIDSNFLSLNVCKLGFAMQRENGQKINFTYWFQLIHFNFILLIWTWRNVLIICLYVFLHFHLLQIDVFLRIERKSSSIAGSAIIHI